MKSLSLLLSILLVVGCTPASYSSDLIELFPMARHSAPVTGQGYLGSAGFAPYREGDFSLTEEWLLNPDGEVRLGLFLYQLQPLRLSLEAEAPTPTEVELQLHERLHRRLLSPGRQLVDLTFEAGDLKTGLNWLTISRGPVRWRSLLVEPLHPGLSSVSGRALSPELVSAGQGQALLLPFEQPLEYPVGPGPECSLEMNLETRVEPGIVEMDEGQWELRVSWREDASASEVHQSLGAEGTSSIVLPPCARAGSLRLTAHHKGPRGPIPGQVGLLLTRLVLVRKSTSPPEALSYEDLVLTTDPPGLYLKNEPNRNIILERPATTLHLQWRRGSSRVETGEDTSRDLRTLQYL